MKNILYITFVFILSNVYANDSDSLLINNISPRPVPMHVLSPDCDACGCSASGGSMGFSSLINAHFIGVRYFHQKYQTNEMIYADSPWKDEHYNTIQLWGKIPVANKLKLMLLVPYHFHSKDNMNEDKKIAGLGDINTMLSYSVYKTKNDSAQFFHDLQIGGGVKIPSGKYKEANNGSVNPSFQLGTGSWDYSILAEYVVKRKQWGINNMLNYIIKTENDKNYQFGNQLNYSSTLFYVKEWNKLVVIPQVGIAGEVYDANTNHNQTVLNTKGDILFGKFGVEMGKDRFGFGVNAMLPISQNLTGGRVKADYRFSLSLNYSL